MLGWPVSRRRALASFERTVYRTRQVLHQLRPRDRGAIDRDLAALLSPAANALVARLTPADRAHLLEVRARLVARGCEDPALLEAALLHDVGKVDALGRVRLPDRIALVLLGRWAPGLLDRLTRSDRRWVHGLTLAREHPRLGAALARDAGCSPRVCWLIAHHHDAEMSDPALALLHDADEV